MNIILIILSVILVIGGSLVIFLAFFKHEKSPAKTIRLPKSEDPTEEDLVQAILDSIQNGDWETQNFATSQVMSNKNTGVKIYIDGSISGMFCFDAYQWHDRSNRAKIVDAYKAYSGITRTGWSAIEAITGYKKPDDDVDPAVLKEAKKNLKLWTR